VAWEELARQSREPNRPFFESRDGQQKSLNQQPPGAFSRGVAAAPINFAATQASGGGKAKQSADEPSNPLAVFRVPPTQKQVVEHICEEIDHAISVARSADDLAAVAPLLEKAHREMERLMAERGVPPPRLNVGEAARQAARDDASSVKPLSCTPRRTVRV
jgi:hypothetical protein